LSLLLQNGAMAPLTLVGDAPRYLQEIDLVRVFPARTTAASSRSSRAEALKRAVTREIQVGSAAPAPFVAKTGPCNTCHSGAASLPNLLQGLDDRRTCFACHSSLAFEPDAAIDIRVHAVHARSQRFAALGRITDCALCHLTPPAGPARGLLPSSSQP
jgi:predicted CXXCH cytochrome family protein